MPGRAWEFVGVSIWEQLGVSGRVWQCWECLGASESVSEYLGASWIVWESGRVWECLRVSGSFWECLGSYEVV